MKTCKLLEKAPGMQENNSSPYVVHESPTSWYVSGEEGWGLRVNKDKCPTRDEAIAWYALNRQHAHSVAAPIEAVSGVKRPLGTTGKLAGKARITAYTVGAIVVAILIDAMVYKALILVLYDLNKLRGANPHDILIPSIGAAIATGYLSMRGACYLLKKANGYNVFMGYSILIVFSSFFMTNAEFTSPHPTQALIIIVTSVLGRVLGAYFGRSETENVPV